MEGGWLVVSWLYAAASKWRGNLFDRADVWFHARSFGLRVLLALTAS